MPEVVRHGDWMSLDHLPKGALFETVDGVRAVKSEYLVGEGRPGDQWQCILLGSGEYAHFKYRNLTTVRELFVCSLTETEQLERYG